MLSLSRISSKAASKRRFKTADTVVTTEQADTQILMDLRSGRYFTLNGVGGVIWSTLATGASLDGVITRVREEFDASDEELTRDVEEFVDYLLSAKLIRRDG